MRQVCCARAKLLPVIGVLPGRQRDDSEETDIILYVVLEDSCRNNMGRMVKV